MKRYIVAGVLYVLAVSPTAAQRLLLKHATIIDGDAAVAPRQGSILIENGLIRKIFSKDETIKADAARVIDCSGKFICPGLIDAHVHLATGNLTDSTKAANATDSILLNMMRHGITTVRDMAGNALWLRRYASLAREKGSHYPDLFYAAQFAGPSYFQLINRGSRTLEGSYPWSRCVTDTTNIRQAVTEARNLGVTGIKIYASLSPALLEAITKEAHRQGMQAWSHAAVNPVLPLETANAAVNSMSHAHDLLFQQFPPGSTSQVWQAVYKGLQADSVVIFPVLDAMKKNGVVLDATLYLAANNKLVNAATITRWAHARGVVIDAGTDWPYPRRDTMVPLFSEMQLLVTQAGLSNQEALQAATQHAARATGLADRGVLRKGKRADLIVLLYNPLQELSSLFAPELVIKNGEIMTD